MHLGTSRRSAHGHCWIKSTNVEVKIISDIVSLNGRTRSFSEKGEAAIQIMMAMKFFLTSCMKRSLQKDMSEDLFSIHQDLEATGTLGEVMVSKNDYIIAQNVLQVKSYLGSSIVAFLDKNDNCCIIVCAFLFWKKIYIAYMLDVDHFQRIVNKPDQEIIALEMGSMVQSVS